MPSTAVDALEALLAVGIAEQLAAWDLGAYAADGYTGSEPRPIYLGPAEPSNAPDERLIVTPHPGVAVPGSRFTVDVPVGFNWRGPAAEPPAEPDPLAGINFVGLLRRRLEGLRGRIVFGEIPVSGIRHTSSGSLGSDAQRRPGASANYLFRCRMATANS